MISRHLLRLYLRTLSCLICLRLLWLVFAGGFPGQWSAVPKMAAFHLLCLLLPIGSLGQRLKKEENVGEDDCMPRPDCKLFGEKCCEDSTDPPLVPPIDRFGERAPVQGNGQTREETSNLVERPKKRITRGCTYIT